MTIRLHIEDFTGPVRTYTQPDGTPINEIKTVDGWVPFWREVPSATIYRPEMLVIDAVGPYLDPPRTNGTRGLKVFKWSSRHDAGYYRQYAVPNGSRFFRAEACGHCWFSQADDPHKSQFKKDGRLLPIVNGQSGMALWVGIDKDGGTDPWADSVQWEFAHIYDRHDWLFCEVDDPGPLVTAFIRSTVDYPFPHSDAYWGTVEAMVGLPSAEPSQVDYVVVANLLPQDATKAEFAHVLDTTYTERQSIVYSADDAARLVAPGLDGSYVRAWAPDRWAGDIGQWLLDRGVDVVEFAEFGDSPTEPPVIPQPPEPPVGNEPQHELRSNNLIGLHAGFTRALTFPYIEQSGTTINKQFAAGDAYIAAQKAPGIISIWRKYVGNEQGRIFEHDTPRDAARWYLDQYTAELETARKNMGLTLAQFLARPIALEALNETIPTYNVPVLQAAVACDAAFSELAHERYGDAIQTVLLCGAIGNPHESEVPYLLDAAKVAAKWGDFLGYHCYWTAIRGRSFLSDHWEYHAGRWAEWDEYFRSQGVYPRYASGEGGIVYSPSQDGTSFDAGQGWKAAGSFEPYLHDMSVFNALVRDWNGRNGNRHGGLTIFGYGNWGWDSFELGDGEVRLMLQWAANPTIIYQVPAVSSVTIQALTAASAMWEAALEKRAQENDLEAYLQDATYISDELRGALENRERVP